MCYLFSIYIYINIYIYHTLIISLHLSLSSSLYLLLQLYWYSYSHYLSSSLSSTLYLLLQLCWYSYSLYLSLSLSLFLALSLSCFSYIGIGLCGHQVPSNRLPGTYLGLIPFTFCSHRGTPTPLSFFLFLYSLLSLSSALSFISLKPYSFLYLSYIIPWLLFHIYGLLFLCFPSRLGAAFVWVSWGRRRHLCFGNCNQVWANVHHG